MPLKALDPFVHSSCNNNNNNKMKSKRVKNLDLYILPSIYLSIHLFSFPPGEGGVEEITPNYIVSYTSIAGLIIRPFKYLIMP